jgi:hypothetical protein
VAAELDLLQERLIQVAAVVVVAKVLDQVAGVLVL